MILKNIDIVEKKIRSACLRCGRSRGEVTLVAVSKTKPVSDILKAADAGVMDFGENKAREFSSKVKEIERNIRWHFIGHLQTNKVKYIIDDAYMIHSVDSKKLADEIQKRAERISKIQKILIEVKTTDELTKFGISDFDELFNLVDYCSKLKNVEALGLMTMAPYTDDESLIRNSFNKLRELKAELKKQSFDLPELSMGMSGDYEIAIEEGATIIRIGSAIFGQRIYH